MAKSQKTVADVKVANQLVHIEQQLQKILDGYDCKDAGWYSEVADACETVDRAAHEAKVAAGVLDENLGGGDLKSALDEAEESLDAVTDKLGRFPA